MDVVLFPFETVYQSINGALFNTIAANILGIIGVIALVAAVAFVYSWFEYGTSDKNWGSKTDYEGWYNRHK